MSSPSAPDQTPPILDASFVIANGRRIESRLPCSIAEFLVAQHLLPRSVVVEHNGQAVAPSEFARRQVRTGDRLEIVKIVAGG
jgi:thiamine biosynthesis protein ThiS